MYRDSIYMIFVVDKNIVLIIEIQWIYMIININLRIIEVLKTMSMIFVHNKRVTDGL